MDEVPKNQLDTLQVLLERAQLMQHAGSGGKPYLILPPEYDVKEIESLLEVPSRKRGTATFTRAASFCDYIDDQKLEQSRLYVCSATQIVCVLNHHPPGPGAGWGDHRAVYNLTRTPEWVTWTQNNNQPKPQRDFARFIEDNSDGITEPSGADLLDLIRTIRLSQSLECTGEVNDRGDIGSAGYVLAAKTKAGAKQEIELPAQFTVTIAPYEGGQPIPLMARLGIDISGTRFNLRYELVRVQQAEKRALELIVEDISTQTGMEAWYGQPS